MFTINLNDQAEFTRENVARLIGSVLDTRNWQLRVRTDGTAYLSDVVGNLELEGLAFRMETWIAGNNYVGFRAEHDARWVDQVYRDLRANWPKPKSTHVDW